MKHSIQFQWKQYSIVKRIAIIAFVLIIGAIVFNYYHNLSYTHPSPSASLNRNYDLVCQETQKQFPGVIAEASPYSMDNGYIMGFTVRKGTAPTKIKQIIDYAYPRWVTIRRWAGMGETSSECNVTIFDTNGNVVSPNA